MLITLIDGFGFRDLSLPEKVSGQYWLYGTNGDTPERLVSIEGIGDSWFIKSNRRVQVIDNKGTVVKRARIEPKQQYSLRKDNAEEFLVLAEPATEDRVTFRKFAVPPGSVLSIGRVSVRDICYNEATVSSLHATLRYENGSWSLSDELSTNGTFVNAKRTTGAKLVFGDVVYVMGMRIIIGDGFLAINNPDGKVFTSGKLTLMQEQQTFSEAEEEYELDEPDYFYRSPRFKRTVKTAEFKIDAPPTSPIANEMPWPLVMGSSFAMGMMSTTMLVSAIITKNTMSIVMGGSMMVGTLLLPIITKIYERRRNRKKEQLRQTRYKEYLEEVGKKIEAECALQKAIRRENDITVYECVQRIDKVQRTLWERATWHDDFLRVRVGTGNGKLDAEIHFPEKHFTIEDDNLVDELYNLAERENVLQDIPIGYSLQQNFASGVIGNRSNVVQFAKGMLVQLSALYSYDDVKFVFLYDSTEEKDLGFVKWLPHVWNDEKSFRYIATDINEAKEVSAQLNGEFETRLEMSAQDLEDVHPYYLFFAFSKKLADRCEIITKVLTEKENRGMSVITFYDELKNLPKECSLVVELNGDKGKLYDKDNISGEYIEFKPDIIWSDQFGVSPRELSVTLANVRLDSSVFGSALPKTVTFLEMFGVGKVEHLNAPTRWKENDPSKSLSAEVGIDTLGELFKLDLHEKFHGPHGLVAGMTGSGKSEFIISYILSLALNYHPYEVAFVLIDYKGGGMAKSFEKLPHTAGIITNLDGAAIKRSLVSIESELKRRQAIFAETGKAVGVSNIDIYRYQRLYREGKVKEPLQHLFIISDEFAELKTQQPEFMTQLVSAARIGRSLGVHLILATQKPSGVVDDQIWSNSRFRVCLKVQERTDSMDMLKRPDAAELKETGRFYLQVGYNEMFELGQSAWSGAPYYPSETVLKEKDNSVVVIDRNGHPIREVRVDKRKALFKNAPKQLDVITEYLRKTAEDENIHIRPLWLEPIPGIILLDEVKTKYKAKSEQFILNPVIGEYDDPARQRQCLLRLPISEEGNVVVFGAAGCGKTSFLNAMVYSLIHEHTPDEVNLYILDFAAETLRVFSQAPHVGEVILSHEAEKLGNLLKMLRAEVENRRKLFSDYGGDYRSYIKNSGKTVPSIVIVINNYKALVELYEEKDEAISYLSREGVKYGIYFVLTVLGSSGVRFQMLQNFKLQFVLQLNDETDYATIVGKTEGMVPSKFKGRGLVRKDELYEFQIASLTGGEQTYSFIQKACKKLREEWNGETARRIPILPKNVDVGFLMDHQIDKSLRSIPIGVEKSSLKVHYYPFGDNYVNIVTSSGTESRSFIDDFCDLVGQTDGQHVVIFDAGGMLNETPQVQKVCVTAKECEEMVQTIFQQAVYRNNTYKDAFEKGVECEEFEDLMIVITSLSDLRNSLSSDGDERLSLILEKGKTQYRMWVVIADPVSTFNGVSYSKWYKASVTGKNVIWIGSGFGDQYLFKGNKSNRELREDISDGFGYSLINGQMVKVKMLSSVSEDEEDEQ